MTPEALARESIDQRLAQAGWLVHNTDPGQVRSLACGHQAVASVSQTLPALKAAERLSVHQNRGRRAKTVQV